MPERDGWEELRHEIEEYDFEQCGWETEHRAAILAIVDRLAAARGEPGLDAMARDLADVVRRAPDAFCDLSGARHADLVERRVILAALATPTTPEPAP